MKFNKETCLQTMFDMQNSLQNAIGEKRGTLCPSRWMDTQLADKHRTMAKESGYYMMSTVTELFEMFEQLKKDNYEITDLTRFELTDAWHFMMNQLLYLNIHPKQTLEVYYNAAVDALRQVTFVNHDLHYLVGELIEAVGEIYQNTSYKMWKTYDVPKEDPLKLAELGDVALVKFMQLYVALGMSMEDIWTFYYKKNEENFKRQEKGGRYEK